MHFLLPNQQPQSTKRQENIATYEFCIFIFWLQYGILPNAMETAESALTRYGLYMFIALVPTLQFSLTYDSVCATNV